MSRKNSKQSGARVTGEWVRRSEAVLRLGIPRSTLDGRIVRGDYKTRVLSGVVFVWIEHAKAAA